MISSLRKSKNLDDFTWYSLYLKIFIEIIRKSIRCWISSRMWGWYTLDVSSLAPSFWKMGSLISFDEKSWLAINDLLEQIYYKYIHFWYLREKIIPNNFAINDSKHYQTKFWESIRLWISYRMWGRYTSDVSGLAPSFCKMVPLILFNKKVSNLWQVQMQEKLQIFLHMTFYRNWISQNKNLAQFYHWKKILFTKWELH